MFCCYDLSTATTPEYGEFDSKTEIETISKILIPAGKIGAKLFDQPPNNINKRRILNQFITHLREISKKLRLEITQRNKNWKSTNASNNLNSSNSSNSNSNRWNMKMNKNNKLSIENIEQRRNACDKLLNEFESAMKGEIDYPFQENVSRCLSTLIRFLLKAVMNAREFLEFDEKKDDESKMNTIRAGRSMTPALMRKSNVNTTKCNNTNNSNSNSNGNSNDNSNDNGKNVKQSINEILKSIPIPAWYDKLGTYTVLDENGNDQYTMTDRIPDNAEFIPYHAAELSLQLKCHDDIQAVLQKQHAVAMLKMNGNGNGNGIGNGNANVSMMNQDMLSYEEVMESLGYPDDPIIFFQEMSIVLHKTPDVFFGDTVNENRNDNSNKISNFEDYLNKCWKELKEYLKDVSDTKCKELYFYLPLLHFRQFLKQQEIIQQQRDEADARMQSQNGFAN